MEQPELLSYTFEKLESLGLNYMLVGSLASTTYGIGRATLDIDIVIALPPSRVDDLCDLFPEPDFYLSRQAVRDAVKASFQFNVLHTGSGNKIDFMMPWLGPWGREQMRRRQKAQVFPGLLGYVATPEDVILGKMLYYRDGGSEKHLGDIAGVLNVSGARVDRNYILEWSRELGVNPIWDEILKRIATLKT